MQYLPSTWPQVPWRFVILQAAWRCGSVRGKESPWSGGCWYGSLARQDINTKHRQTLHVGCIEAGSGGGGVVHSLMSLLKRQAGCTELSRHKLLVRNSQSEDSVRGLDACYTPSSYTKAAVREVTCQDSGSPNLLPKRRHESSVHTLYFLAGGNEHLPRSFTFILGMCILDAKFCKIDTIILKWQRHRTHVHLHSMPRNKC